MLRKSEGSEKSEDSEKSEQTTHIMPKKLTLTIIFLIALIPSFAQSDDSLVIKDITEEVPYGHRWAVRSREDVDIIVMHSSFHVPHFIMEADSFDTRAIIAQFRHYGTAGHYLVERDGTVLKMVDEREVAYHAGRSRLPGTDRSNLNQNSIGIEVVSAKDNGPTPAQYRALLLLVKDICSRFDIRYLVRHADIAPDRRDDPWGFDWPWFADQVNAFYPDIEIPRNEVKEVKVLK